MARNKPPTADLLARAADLRAAGRPWDQVGADLGCSPETVRKWPLRYAGQWRRVAADAERRLVAEATAEAVLTLRKQLRSDDEKSGRDAAHKIIQFRLALEKKRPARPPKPVPHSVQVDRFTRGLTDEQFHDVEAVGGGAGD